MHKIKLILSLSFLFFSLLFADENTNVNISNVWISEAPPTVSVLAAYATIENLSDQTQTLTSVTSSSFSKIELHLSKVVDEMATMEKQETLMIPAKDSIEFTPGAYHLMLFDPKISLKAGDKINLIFTFADNTSHNIEALVEKRNNDNHEHHHHNSH